MEHYLLNTLCTSNISMFIYICAQPIGVFVFNKPIGTNYKTEIIVLLTFCRLVIEDIIRNGNFSIPSAYHTKNK